MDSSTWQLFAAGGLILVLAIGAYIERRRGQQVVQGRRNPRPSAKVTGISQADQQERAAFVLTQVRDLDQLPWGQHAVQDRREAERIYQGALDAIADAEGDYRKLVPVVDDLLKLPLDLAWSGVARIIMTLSYFQGGKYSPEGVQAALAYTSRAITLDPLSVDAWIMRLEVACSVADTKYAAIAKAAMKQVEKLNPNHPRFPSAQSQFYKRFGPKQQYEAALHRMIELAPSPVVKRAGYDRLAMYYASLGRLDDTLATYQQYLREYPEGSAWLWHNYSLFLMQAKRYQEALDASNHALSFFEFDVARNVNNRARQALGMAPVTTPADRMEN